ncbi:MAG: hypothetical protein ACO3A2_11090 [Bdellovibrionia bacterium]
MAKDPHGRVWIDRIRWAKSEVNSYGTDKWIIDSGFLTNKPLEYQKQATALAHETEKNIFAEQRDYVDITPLLHKLLPIQKFIEAESKRPPQ